MTHYPKYLTTVRSIYTTVYLFAVEALLLVKTKQISIVGYENFHETSFNTDKFQVNDHTSAICARGLSPLVETCGPTTVVSTGSSCRAVGLRMEAQDQTLFTAHFVEVVSWTSNPFNNTFKCICTCTINKVWWSCYVKTHVVRSWIEPEKLTSKIKWVN